MLLGVTLGPVVPARAADAIHIAPVVIDRPSWTAEDVYIGAAAWSATVTVTGSVEPGVDRVRAQLIEVDGSCTGSNGASSATLTAPVTGSFAIGFPASTRPALRDGMRICARIQTSSDAGASWGPWRASLEQPLLDLSLTPGSVAIDAAGVPADAEPGPGVRLQDFINAGEVIAGAPGTISLAPVSDGDPDRDAGTHADVRSVELRLRSKDQPVPAACIWPEPRFGATVVRPIPAACLDALADGSLTLSARWTDRAGNIASAVAVEHPVLDRLAPAAPSVSLPAVITTNNVAAAPAYVTAVEPGASVTVAAWRDARTVGHPLASASSVASSSTIVPIDLRALADCAEGERCIEVIALATDPAGNLSSEGPITHAAKDTAYAAPLTVTPRFAAVVVEPDGDRRVELDDAGALALQLDNDEPGAEPVTWRLTVDDLDTPGTAPSIRAGALDPGDGTLVLAPVTSLIDGELDATLEVFDAVGNDRITPLQRLGFRIMRRAGSLLLTQPDPSSLQPRTVRVAGLARNGPLELRLDGSLVDAHVVTGGTFTRELTVTNPREPDGSVRSVRTLSARSGDDRFAVRITVDDTLPGAPVLQGPMFAGVHLALDGVLSGELTGIDDDAIGSPDAVGVLATETLPTGERAVPVRVTGSRFVVDILPGAPGLRTITLRSVDEAGNRGEPVRLEVIAVHPAAPVPPSIDPPHGVPDLRPTPPPGCTDPTQPWQPCFTYLTAREAPDPTACGSLEPGPCLDGLLGRRPPYLPL